jgi:hypothetical protein
MRGRRSGFDTAVEGEGEGEGRFKDCTPELAGLGWAGLGWAGLGCSSGGLAGDALARFAGDNPPPGKAHLAYLAMHACMYAGPEPPSWVTLRLYGGGLLGKLVCVPASNQHARKHASK